MQLKLLNRQIEAYREYLRGPQAEERLYVWESQRIFQEHWDLEAADLARMYDASLENSRTRRLWRREHYEPKAMMLHFLKQSPEFVRSMFRDLFNQEKSIDGRAQRFVFYCDELLQEYKKAHPRSIENNHYHDDDYHMVFLYLAFRYPARYALYDFDAFVGTLRSLGVTQLPRANDLPRFVKVTATLDKLLRKDEVLLDRHRQRLGRDERSYQGESRLLVYDFYQFCTAPSR